ncbi:rRNA/tRNA 2'-O-methyltransferase fibrillarin-like protein 1 [Drosophila biarmipes]|uniref:rRNA/tRNA 2'-O-methyltransferase fibrillarin-like protein 1 n=1 Tax=Drosophila biarmipes TaxID=125945 RepID=UPI0007E5C029|nr:rRNA/tRNA 2'-O-methyltransferase fibrillarin-like protein 1 [Drosophila biarmipes]
MSKEFNAKRRPRGAKPRGGGAPGKSSRSDPPKISSMNSVNTTKKTSMKSPNPNYRKPSSKNSSKNLRSANGSEGSGHSQTQDKSFQGRDQGQEVKVESKIYNLPLDRIEPHRHSGVFLSRNRFDAIQLLTRNTSSSSDDYGERRIFSDFRGKRSEFRAWSPFQSKLAAGIMGGACDLHLKSGSKVLYLGAGFGRSVSHISDIVGESGMVYAVEQGPWAGRQLTSLANSRSNIVPVIEDATMPYKYRLEVPACIEVIFSDLPQADQIRSLMLNARHFLVPGGHFVVYLQAASGNDGASNKEAFEVDKKLLREHQLEPIELVLLDPFKPGYALVVGVSTRKDVPF